MTRGDPDALYQIVVEADPNLVFIADATGKIVRVNSRWLEYTGVGPEGMAVDPGTPLNVAHPDDLEQTWARWKRSVETGEPFEMTYRLRSVRDGRYRWFLARASPYREDSGELIGWYGVATDIDAQVRAGENARFLSEISTALTSSFNRRTIVDSFMKVVISRFSDGCVVTLLDENRNLKREGLAHRDPAIEWRARENLSRNPFPASPIIKRVYETRRPVLMPDVFDESHKGWINAGDARTVQFFNPTYSVLAVPLLIAGVVGGTLTFMSSQPGKPFDVLDLEVTQTVARQAATALEHAALFARERETTERFRYLANATDQLFAARDFKENLERLVQSLVGYWADWAALYMIETDGSVRVQFVSYANTESAFLEELRGQRPFHPDAEYEFRDIVAKHRSRLRVDVPPKSIRAIMQPYLTPLADRLLVRSLLIIPLFTIDADFGAIGIYLNERNYTETDRELFEELGRRVSLALEHAHSLGRERRLASTLQEVTLPTLPSSIWGVQLSNAYAAATASESPVGGDWYDAFLLEEGRIVFSIGDVSGKGLQASAIMGKVRQAINAISLYEPDPARILDAVEYVTLQRYPEALVTAFVAIYDPGERTIRFANAGHPYPLVRNWNGTIGLLQADGLMIGIRSLAPPAQSVSRSLDDAALLVFYTDGVTEVNRDLLEGEGRLYDALRSEGSLYVRSPASLIAAGCLPEGAHEDDAAIMVATFLRSQAWAFDAEDARAAHHARGDFLRKLTEQADPKSDFASAEIIFGELIGNVVRHAPGAIDVALEWNKTQAVLHVIDRGPGFDFVPPEQVDVMREGGRGLWLIQKFGSAVMVEHLRGFGTHVAVNLPVWRNGVMALR